jgi:hypothetical protein
MSAFCTAETLPRSTVAFLSFPTPGMISAGMAIIEQLASDDVLDCAYEWLCRRRRDYSADSDVWALRIGGFGKPLVSWNNPN